MQADHEGKPRPAFPPLIHYWHESPPSEVVETLSSFEQHNPGMQQLVFDASTAEEFIGAHYGAREATAFRACAIPAMQADYFRYCAVHALGGVYADANFRCLDSVRWLIEGPERGILFGRQDPVPERLAAQYNWSHAVGPFRTVTNGMFGFKECGHSLLELAIEVATANIEKRVADGPVGVWLTAGPGVFTSVYLLHELGSINAFIEYAANSVIEPSASLFCEIVGDYARIARIFDGVNIRPLKQRDALAVKARGFKAKRSSGRTPWIMTERSIYR